MYFYSKSLFILIVVYVFLLFVHVFILLSMYSYCSSTYSYCCLCTLIVVYVFLDAATLTEVFPCFFLGCKANARVILAKMGHGQHSSKIVVLLYVLFVLYCSMYCLCVNVYCHRVTTQLQLTNISISNGTAPTYLHFKLSQWKAMDYSKFKHPSPAPHYKTFQVFLICCPMHPRERSYTKKTFIVYYTAYTASVVLLIPLHFA